MQTGSGEKGEEQEEEEEKEEDKRRARREEGEQKEDEREEEEEEEGEGGEDCDEGRSMSVEENYLFLFFKTSKTSASALLRLSRSPPGKLALATCGSPSSSPLPSPLGWVLAEAEAAFVSFKARSPPSGIPNISAM